MYPPGRDKDLSDNPAFDRRLEIIRNDVAIQLGIVMMLIELAATYAHHGFDDLLDSAMKDARERMRAALGYTAKLMQERRDGALNGEAAEEWRATRRRPAA